VYWDALRCFERSSSARRLRSRELPTYQEQGYVFGTLWKSACMARMRPSAKAVAAAMQEFQRLHDLLHAWKPSP